VDRGGSGVVMDATELFASMRLATCRFSRRFSIGSYYSNIPHLIPITVFLPFFSRVLSLKAGPVLAGRWSSPAVALGSETAAKLGWRRWPWRDRCSSWHVGVPHLCPSPRKTTFLTSTRVPESTPLRMHCRAPPLDAHDVGLILGSVPDLPAPMLCP
jgi:hypothetical protein